MIMPRGMVRLGFLVTAAMETGAIVVPWQAQPITANAETKPVKPPWKKPPSALEKVLAKSTLGRPKTTKMTREATRTSVMMFSRMVMKREPLMVERKNRVIAINATSV